MLGTVGFIGYGFVGKACHTAFEYNCEPFIVDPAYSSSTIADLVAVSPKVIFLSLPAPTLQDGKVDISIIREALTTLAELKCTSLIVIKSTITPDLISELMHEYSSQIRIVYSPEFLREQHWQTDAINPKLVLVSGDFHDCLELKVLYTNHSHLKSGEIIFMDYTSAAFVKYAINSFLATKVMFFNQLYQVFKDEINEGKEPHPIIWEEITSIIAKDTRIGKTHMNVPGNDGNLGFGGTCFPKDTRAFLEFDSKNHLSILQEAVEANLALRIAKKDTNKS